MNAGEIRFIGVEHDIDTNRYELIAKFRTESGALRRVTVPNSARNKPDTIVAALLDQGSVLTGEAKSDRELIVQALAVASKKVFPVTRKRGWHKSRYVTKSKVYGEPQDGLKCGLRDPVDRALGQAAGDVATWRKRLKEPCTKSDLLVYSMAAAFAAPCLDILEETEGGVIGVVGKTSTGKTLSIRAALSVSGRVAAGDIPTFDALSELGLLDYCAERNDNVAALDEGGTIEGDEKKIAQIKRKIAFRLAGGVGKIYSRHAQQQKTLAQTSFKTIVLTSDEHPMETAATIRRGGERLRYIFIPSPEPHLGGIFNHLPDGIDNASAERRRLADVVKVTIRENYGVAFPPYIEWLVENRSQCEVDAKAILEEFIALVSAQHEPWEERFASKFGIFLVGAVFAVRAKVAPWTEERAWESIEAVYRLARRSVFTVSESTEELLQKIRSGKLDKRFPRLERGSILSEERLTRLWGFRRVVDDVDVIAITREQLGLLAGSLPLADAILDICRERGLLLQAKAGDWTHSLAAKAIYPNGARRRFYCFINDKL